MSERGTASAIGTASASTAGGTESAATVDRNAARRFSPGAATWVGALLMLASGIFIGHTASTSPRALVAASDFTHLAAASVWAGGAIALALTIRTRRRSGARGDTTLLISRFSVSATWCLVLVAVTGVAMTWSILPEPSALWSSAFGWALMIKVALVVAISALGAYNHFVLVPGIQSGDDPETMRARMARTLGTEVVLFVAVIAATAALVGSSPT